MGLKKAGLRGSLRSLSTDVTGIPDSVVNQTVAHYDFSEYDTSTTSDIPDLSDNGNDLTTGSITGYDTINGVQAADFDGVDDFLEPDAGGFNTLTQPFTIFIVADIDQFNTQHRFFARGSNSSEGVICRNGNPDGDENTRMWAGNFGVDEPDLSKIVLTHIFDGSESTLRQNSSESATEDISTNSLDHFQIGGDDGSLLFDRVMGEVRVVDGTIPSVDLNAYEQKLIEKWNV